MASSKKKIILVINSAYNNAINPTENVGGEFCKHKFLIRKRGHRTPFV